jgi:uncharacterized protein (DUF952 family)
VAPLHPVIYHLALSGEWSDAIENGAPYRRSTLGRSLDEEGFIHCSYGHQVQGTADLFYRGRDDVVLLTIDPDLVDVEIRVENDFPHLYGAMRPDAVVAVTPLLRGPDGRLVVGPFSS